MTSTCTKPIQRSVMGMNFCWWNLTVRLVLALPGRRLMLRQWWASFSGIRCRRDVNYGDGRKYIDHERTSRAFRRTL